MIVFILKFLKLYDEGLMSQPTESGPFLLSTLTGRRSCGVTCKYLWEGPRRTGWTPAGTPPVTDTFP